MTTPSALGTAPSRPSDHHVVVIGASMAGLAVAGVLAPLVRTVTLIERDRLADHADLDQVAHGHRRASTHDPAHGPVPVTSRRSVPQGRHAHALLAAGREALDRIFPGVIAEVTDAGGLRVDGAANNIWYQVGGRRVRYQSAVDGVCMSRPLLERTVRERVRSLPNVVIVDDASVHRLLFAPDHRSVVGVTVRSGGTEVDLPADLVVDAGGRNAPLLDQLVEAGYPPIPIDRVAIDLAYASVVVDRRPGDLGGADYLVAMGSPPYGRGGIVLPIEDDRWIVTLNGSHGDRPPIDAEGVAAFAASIPVPELGELLADGRATGATPHRFPSSQRRRVERVRRHPAGYVLVGDAVSSFNPAFGQGMTAAVLQAERLAATVERHGVRSARLPRATYRAIAKVVDNPWRIAVGTDFVDPRTTGPKPRGTDLINRYMKVVLRAGLVSPAVNEQMVRVQNLLASPSSLLRPDIAVRAVAAARRAPTLPVRRGDRTPAADGSAVDASATANAVPTATAVPTAPGADDLAMVRQLAEADVHRLSR